VGETLATLGRYAEAVKPCERALEIRRSSLPKDHPRIAHLTLYLGALWADQRIYQRAFPLFKEALEMRLRSLPPTHPDVVATLEHIADLLEEMGQQGDAAAYRRQVMSIRECGILDQT
jgi:tetratricopeptide (TPR) repeat protein